MNKYLYTLLWVAVVSLFLLNLLIFIGRNMDTALLYLILTVQIIQVSKPNS